MCPLLPCSWPVVVRTVVAAVRAVVVAIMALFTCTNWVLCVCVFVIYVCTDVYRYIEQLERPGEEGELTKGGRGGPKKKYKEEQEALVGAAQVAAEECLRYYGVVVV